jgi:hypothetical protein
MARYQLPQPIRLEVDVAVDPKSVGLHATASLLRGVLFAGHLCVHAVITLQSPASEEIVTVVEEYLATLLGQVPVIEIKLAEISDQIPVPLPVIGLERPRQAPIQVRQSDRPFRIRKAVHADNVKPRKTMTVLKTKFNAPFSTVSSRNSNFGSLAGHVIRFDLEPTVELGQDPEEPKGVVENNLRQRLSSVLAKRNGSPCHVNLKKTRIWCLD